MYRLAQIKNFLYFKPTLKSTLALFTPLALLLVVLTGIILYSLNISELQARKYTEQQTVSMQVTNLSHYMTDIYSDLDIIVNNQYLRDLWNDDARLLAENKQKLGNYFLNIAHHRKLYNQIRLIDENGMESVRVNYSNNHAALVENKGLQNKKGRYYFDDAFKLQQGEVFVSPLDLNIEQGEIEQPLKPMLRVATPVFDQQGQKRGIILLNYFGAQLLDFLSDYMLSHDSQTMLLNAEGYWLKSINTEDEWGFMFKGRESKTFGHKYPQVWENILKSGDGQIKTDAGLFTFKTIYPLPGKRLQGWSEKYKDDDIDKQGLNRYNWKIISFVPSAVLVKTINNRYQTSAWVLGFLFVVLFMVAWFIARTRLLHKISEQKLIRFSRVIEASQNEVYIFDKQTLLIEGINKGALDNLGYTRQEINQLTPLDFQPKLDRQAFSERVKPLLNGTESSISYVTDHQRKNGSHYPVEVQLDLIDENPAVFVAFVIDISERLKSEGVLQQAKVIVESSRAVLFRWKAGKNWPVEMISDNIIQFGYTAQQFISGEIKISEVLHPDDLEKFRETVSVNSTKGIDCFDQEYRIISPSGEVFWVDDQTVILRNSAGKATHYQGIVIDITARKEMEEELRKLAQAVEQSPESIVITNIRAEIEYVNETFIKKTGYQRAEVLGQNPRVLQSGKTPRSSFANMWENLSAGKLWTGEFYNKRKDGSEYIEFVQISPIRQEDGVITHYLALKEDITEKKRLGNELDRYRHHLEEMVNERTRQLLEEREKAEAANLAKSTFLANMSHEIRTPMNAILGLTDLLQRSELTDPQQQRLQKITGSAKHLLTLLNDILDISKIEADKLTLEKADFQIDSVFENVKTLLSDQAKAKGLFIFVENPLAIWVNGDVTRLTQALLNYAGNAIKFTQRGGIYLRAKLLEESDHDLLIRFEVEDSGIGIEADKLDRLFDSFEQADLSTTRKYGGTGLGLAITRNLARLMDGDTGVSSEPGSGSTFWFTARLNRPDQIGQDQPESKIIDAESYLRQQSTGARVLLVEDNEINLEVADGLLKSVGILTDFAENGREAVGKVVVNNYDVILMDVQMPEMDGLEATRIIREIDGLSDIPIIAMTANVFEEDRQACFDAGMNDFVAKPVNSQNLFSTLIKWLPGVKDYRQNRMGETAQLSADEASQLSSIPVAESKRESTGTPLNFHTLQNMFGDDKNRQLQFLHKFLLQAESITDEMKHAYENSDIEQVAFFAHKLKSSARAVGADLVADLYLDLELLAKENKRSALPQKISEVAPALQQLKNSIRKFEFNE